MLLRVCDMCGDRHVEYFKYTNAIRRSDVRIPTPYNEGYQPVDTDDLRLSDDGRAQFTAEICYACASSVYDLILSNINQRRAIKSRPTH